MLKLNILRWGVVMMRPYFQRHFQCPCCALQMTTDGVIGFHGTLWAKQNYPVGHLSSTLYITAPTPSTPQVSPQAKKLSRTVDTGHVGHLVKLKVWAWGGWYWWSALLNHPFLGQEVLFGVFSNPGGDIGAGVRDSLLAACTPLWRELWC